LLHYKCDFKMCWFRSPCLIKTGIWPTILIIFKNTFHIAKSCEALTKLVKALQIFDKCLFKTIFEAISLESKESYKPLLYFDHKQTGFICARLNAKVKRNVVNKLLKCCRVHPKFYGLLFIPKCTSELLCHYW
jgi:hypothetical protein